MNPPTPRPCPLDRAVSFALIPWFPPFSPSLCTDHFTLRVFPAVFPSFLFSQILFPFSFHLFSVSNFLFTPRSFKDVTNDVFLFFAVRRIPIFFPCLPFILSSCIFLPTWICLSFPCISHLTHLSVFPHYSTLIPSFLTICLLLPQNRVYVLISL